MKQESIQITINGEVRQIAALLTVNDLIHELKLAPQQVALELNLDILPKARWAETELRAGDKLEIVHFVGGG